MQQIHVTIDEKGEVKVEAVGCAGSTCAGLTKAIEDAIGRQTADAKKPEYFQPATAKEKAHAGGGQH